MGGQDSSVTSSTKSIFLESAYFAPAVIMDKARRYGLQTDSSYRFERGVDPSLQVTALNYATNLLLEIVGGEAIGVQSVSAKEFLPTCKSINLNKDKLTSLLGFTISDENIARY